MRTSLDFWRSLGILALNRHVPRYRASVAAAAAILFVAALPTTQAWADLILTGTLADASNFAVLYEGTGGHNLSITNVTINGNVGVGGTGAVQFNGPGTNNGALDFTAARSCTPNCSQYSNNNGMNVGPMSVNYSQSNVATNLTNLGTLSSSITGGTSITISNGGETISESTGQLETINGVASRVFNVTSYSANNTDVLTINGDGSGDPVVFNFASGTGNVNLSGTVGFAGAGLTSPDQVLFNFQSAGQNIQLNNNHNVAFQGIILAPNDTISLTSAAFNGRVFGGDSQDMQIVSGDTITAPSPTSVVPEPSTWLLVGSGLLAIGVVAKRKCAA